MPGCGAGFVEGMPGRMPAVGSEGRVAPGAAGRVIGAVGMLPRLGRCIGCGRDTFGICGRDMFGIAGRDAGIWGRA